MSKILILFLAFSLFVVLAQCKQGYKQGGRHGGRSGDDDEGWDDDDSDSFGDDDDWDISGSGWSSNGKKDFVFPRRQPVKPHVWRWNNNGQTVIHLKNCHVSNCAICMDYNCRQCMPGFRLKRQPFALGKRCVLDCPLGKIRDANRKCRNIACKNFPNCVKCHKFPWNHSCMKCKKGWYRQKPQNQMNARCVSSCSRGYRATNGTLNYGPTCQKIPFFCFNAPRCVKCDKFPWTRSCLRCENGWYRYKPQYQKIARCLKVCPRGYRANAGTINFGPTCEKIPSFCFNAPRCVKCDKFPWTQSCLQCENGWYRYKPKFQKIARCLKVCPRGYRANAGTINFGPTCEKIPSFCFNAPRCVKCDKFPWTRSCLHCENGWYRYKPKFQKIARCLKVCPRGYRANAGTINFGPTCEKIPSFCFNAPRCVKCDKFPWTRSCLQCENGWYRYKPKFQKIARCLKVCPRGFRGNTGTNNLGPTCEKIPSFCYNAPHCVKCAKFPWTRSCLRCENGWYRYKPQYQLIARCLNVCPRGFRGNAGTNNLGPTCEKIPSFCFNTPRCLKCDKFPWTRSCLRCEHGWYRYKAPNQIVARCLKGCPRGYRANAGTLNFGPTCERIPSFCHRVARCSECDGPQWRRSCKRCNNGWYRYKAPYQSTTRCVRVCPRGYKLTNGTRNFGPTCKRIRSFCHQLYHCDECPGFPSPRSCRRCERGWYRYKPPYHETTRCIDKCPRGYKANNGTRKFGPTCKRIPRFCIRVRHCKECPDEFPLPRSCKRCKKGWYRYIAPNQLKAKCIRKCPRGYQATNGTSDTGQTCEEIQPFCHDLPHCQDCQGPFWPPSCDRCEEGWYRYENPPSQISAICVQDCPSGFQATNGTGLLGPTCEKSQSKCPFMPGCESCPKATVCLQCKTNMSVFEGLVESKCVYKCPKGFDQTVKNGISICLVQEGCLGKLCVACKKGWYKLPHRGRVCHRECPSGYFKYLGNCIKCTPGCMKCKNVYKCEECDSGMAKLTSRLGFGERCVLDCPRGYTRELVNNTFYECRKVCRDNNCENCESVSYHGPHHCDYCKPGFYKLHRNLRDKCVVKCPSGYTSEMDVIEGSVCRKDRGVEPTLNPIPTMTTDDVPTPSLSGTPAPLP